MRLSRFGTQERRLAVLMLRRQVPGPGGPFITVGRIGRVDCERCSMFRAVAVLLLFFRRSLMVASCRRGRHSVLGLSRRDAGPPEDRWRRATHSWDIRRCGGISSDDSLELRLQRKLDGLKAMTVGGWFFTRRAGEQAIFSRGMPETDENGVRRFPPREKWVNFVLGTDHAAVFSWGRSMATARCHFRM